jgi:hypothetical protein
MYTTWPKLRVCIVEYSKIIMFDGIMNYYILKLSRITYIKFERFMYKRRFKNITRKNLLLLSSNVASKHNFRTVARE